MVMVGTRDFLVIKHHFVAMLGDKELHRVVVLLFVMFMIVAVWRGNGNSMKL
jgi:hypothetical protein